ncbi:MAG: hypothetical protein WC984_09780 [Bacteroidales bacterium]
MKKMYLIGIFTLFLITSCTTIRESSSLTLASTRNINLSKPAEKLGIVSYKDKSEMKENKSKTIEGAIDKAMNKYKGGEYMTNVRISVLEIEEPMGKTTYYVAEGDIWGYKEL